MAIDAYRPFPMLLNKSINLAVSIETDREYDKKQKLAIVQVPAVLKRFIEVPFIDGTICFVLLEDVIGFFSRKLFNGYKIFPLLSFGLQEMLI